MVSPQATSVGPDATATMVNNGPIVIDATAVAHNTGTGTGLNRLGHPQQVDRRDRPACPCDERQCDGRLTGTGTIDIGAVANAVADSDVRPSLCDDPSQCDRACANANGGVASVVLSQAAIDIHASAYASGVSAAYAYASVQRGILGSRVIEPVGDYATAAVALTNAGALSIIAAATAIAPKVTIVSNGDFSSTHTIHPICGRQRDDRERHLPSISASAVAEPHADGGHQHRHGGDFRPSPSRISEGELLRPRSPIAARS